MILMMIGTPAEYAGNNHIPARRATFLLGSIWETMILPARLISDSTAAVMQRDFRTFDVTMVAEATQIKVNTDIGSETRIVWNVE
jgi:hypothetical protein